MNVPITRGRKENFESTRTWITSITRVLLNERTVYLEAIIKRCTARSSVLTAELAFPYQSHWKLLAFKSFKVGNIKDQVNTYQVNTLYLKVKFSASEI